MIDEEIRQALCEVREMKQMCGNINMKLTNIVTQRGQDFKKKLEAEYQRGLSEGNDIGYKDGVKDGRNEAWEAAKKIALMDTETSENVTGYFGLFRIMDNLTASEAIAKLKAYEEKQKADDKIEVGDEVIWTEDDDVVIVVTRVYTGNDIELCDGIYKDGQVYSILTENARKTGRHFDIASILEAMKHD